MTWSLSGSSPVRLLCFTRGAFFARDRWTKSKTMNGSSRFIWEERKNMTPSMLSIDKVSISLGGSRILRDVSLEIGANHVFCLMGRNGVGKTTPFTEGGWPLQAEQWPGGF